ncbi:hypothetical protein AB0M39_25590 [Streptomyces sp. NPDC051907]|uniref:hypothetical protein n=1 Tax=Streptomyces sp. NPDC051907 TaxID=3155284 RepID=UPI003419AF55
MCTLPPCPWRQYADLVVIEELLAHVHINVTAVYTTSDATRNHNNDRHYAEPPSADAAVNYCLHPVQRPRQALPGGVSIC